MVDVVCFRTPFVIVLEVSQIKVDSLSVGDLF